MINFEVLRTFEQGYSIDLNNTIERTKTFQKGENGRLYSKNGMFAFSAIDGSSLRYNNDKVYRYVGWFAFEDELILMAKCEKDLAPSVIEKNVTERSISQDSFEATEDTAGLLQIALTDQFSANSSLIENTYTVKSLEESETDFDNKYACSGASETEVNLADYYSEDLSVPNFETCTIDNSVIPINNEDYYDCFISLRYDENNELQGRVIWVGMLNWPVNGKVTAEGVEENQYYKRVYFTDALNVRRVINLKDPQLVNRDGAEFDQVLETTLLQPEIIEVTDGGQLPAMMVQYICRVISENGQVSAFSPASFLTHVITEDAAVEFRGGDVSENTGKKVRLKCNFLDPDIASEVECIAIEFEAFGVPTAIRNLGIRPMSAVVEFDHFGNEPEEEDDITLNDIQERQNTWKYCNDFTSKKNKLIAGGLRNDPLPTTFNNLEYLLPLHSWNSAGETHDCLMNPEPWNYRMIDPTNTDKLVFLNRKVYRSIQSFGPCTITFQNTETSNSYELELADLSLQNYSIITSQILAWLLDLQTSDANFASWFPNLTISDSDDQILFSPTDDSINTDMAIYTITSNNNQYLEDISNEVQFLPVSVDASKLVWGAQSAGFHEGIGVRVSYREFEETIMHKATDVYDGTGKLLDYETPSFEKYNMKGEIYRLGFQVYDQASNQYFTIPLGDVMIPEIGDFKKWIDDNGNGQYISTGYQNQKVVGNELRVYGIKFHFEVRIPCELQEIIPMYQIMFVERTEENRTILCQGIAAPLQRVQDSGSSSHRMPDAVRNKWTLPYYGGPTYEKQGLVNYDTYGENDQYLGEEEARRTMVNRRLMYFDSPDLYYQKISDQYVQSSQLKQLGRLKTDHTPGVIRERGGDVSGGSGFNFGDEVYPKFSRKILEQQIEGNNNSSDLPRFSTEEDYNETWETHFINVSVFAQYNTSKITHEILKAETLERGGQISGAAFNLSNDVSNNTFTFPSQPWFYGSYQRKWTFQDGRPNSEIFASAVTSPGYRTTIIQTANDVFTPTFIGADIHTVDSQIRLGGNGHVVYDVLPLINLFRNNRESVYGGRSEQDYSRNVYIPLSRTIPVLKSSNGTQHFDVGADTYLSLNIRTKNDFGEDDIELREYNNHGGARDKGDIECWKRNGAWCYAVVLETQVEPKLPSAYEFYRVNGSHNFEVERSEIINPAYFNSNSLRTYVPKPFRFKDDPNRGNVVAISDVKLAGENFDSWTRFRANNYYPLLEKNLGDISNLVRHDDNIFAIQKRQTSLLLIGVDRAVAAEDGDVVFQQGSGTVVDGHKVISKYGTGIRRNGIAHDYGMTFFDETRVEFVNLQQMLLSQHALHLEYWDRAKTDPIIDAEVFFDHKHKETNIRLRHSSGRAYILSYNEALKVFNGEHLYDQDIFPMFNQRVFMPIQVLSGGGILQHNNDFHELNVGEMLRVGLDTLKLKIGVHLSANIGKTFIHRGISVNTNMNYKIEQTLFESSLGNPRTILEDHEGYWLKEGMHRIPSKQESDQEDTDGNPRGQWFYVELTATRYDGINDVKTPDKIDILAINNHLRVSHQ